MILLGGGVVWSPATSEAMELAEFLFAPIVTSNGKSGIVPDDYPLSIGRLGSKANKVALQTVAEADVVIAFGCTLNDQTTFGFSRDDAGRFLPLYIESGILADDPFQTIDLDGVGSLIRTAVKLGRETNPKLKIGICGEHGGDPRSVSFCHEVGMNYVSCSPFRIPIARLAAAQAALRHCDE